MTLALLISKTSEFEIIDYLKNPIKFEEIKLIIDKLNIKPIELVRTNEDIWKENYKSKQLTDKEIIIAINKFYDFQRFSTFCFTISHSKTPSERIAQRAIKRMLAVQCFRLF